MPVSKPVAEVVPEVSCSLPAHVASSGRFVKLVPMQAEHADKLFKTIGGPEGAKFYDYMFYGPYPDIQPFREHIAANSNLKDTQFYSIEDLKTGELVGQISHLRIDPNHRVIEIGHIIFGSPLQRTVAATEAFYLMACKAFDQGYRRLEWKCDSSNSASWRAALRFGHTFEGVFRQHMIIKGRNRDSAWFSILDKEWPLRKQALELWMEPNNFDESGKQRQDLTALRSELEKSSILES